MSGGLSILRRAFVAALLALTLLGFPAGDASHVNVPVKNVLVVGDAALLQLAGERHFPGTGTADDPIEIANLVISARSSHGIELKDTRLHIALRALTISSGGVGFDAVRLIGVANVTVEDSTFESNRVGVVVQGSTNVSILRNAITSSQVGVKLEGSSGVRVRDNRIAVNDRDIELASSSANLFRNNNLSIASGQVGFFFADVASYANDLDSTNVVNFLPLRWHTGVAGTADAPLRLPPARMELPGITNVGQVVLIDVAHVVMEGVIARDGLGAGVFVARSSNVTLRGVAAEGNAGPGIAVHGSANVAINVSISRDNRDGLVAEDSPALALTNVTLDGNHGAGAAVTRGDDTRLTGAWADANEGTGILLRQSRNVLVVNATATRNAGSGIVLENAFGARLASNNVHANGASGIALSATSNATLEANEVDGHPQQVSFTDSPRNTLTRNFLQVGHTEFGLFFNDALSYTNNITTTNLVNGEPVRWLVDITGPTVIPDMRVGTRGATNVAQILILRARDVTLDRPLASNGTGHGILILSSENVTLNDAHTEANRAAGVRVDRSQNVTVRNGTVTTNEAGGLAASTSAGLHIAGVTVANNAPEGIVLSGVSYASVSNATITGSTTTGIVAHGPATVFVLENTTLRSNRGGVTISGVDASLVRGNAFTRNGAVGLRLVAVDDGNSLISHNTFQNHSAAIALADSPATRFEGNSIAGKHGQMGVVFEDEASRDVQLPTSNRFNGVPFQWHVRLSNTTLNGVDVTAPGITNVAQLFLLAPQNVTLRNTTLANGRGAGLLVEGGSNVTVTNVTARTNLGSGMLVKTSLGTTMSRVVATGNGQHGIALVGLPGEVFSATLSANGGWGLLSDGGSVLRDARLEGNGLGGMLARAGAFGGLDVARADVVGNGGPGLLVDEGNLTALVAVNATGNAGDGILLRMATGDAPRLAGVNASSNGGAGLHIDGPLPLRVNDSRFMNNSAVGIALVGTYDAVFERNHFERQPWAVSLTTSPVTFYNSTINITSREGGFHFADSASYAAALPSTNVVNGAPLQWYSRVSDVTIEDAVATVPRMTNVAQVMLYDARNVTLVAPVGREGIGAGIAIVSSSDIRLTRPAATGNAEDGIAILHTSNATVDGGNSSANGGAGLSFTNAHVSRAANFTAHDNRGAGVTAVSSTGLSVRGANIAGNEGPGVLLSRAGGEVIDGVFNANGGPAIDLSRAEPGTRVTANVITGHEIGIRLALTQFSRFEENRITMGPNATGFFFEDEASYENVIAVSNRVNDVAMRWYTLLTGTPGAPIRLEGVRVEVRGITNVAQVMVYRSSYVTLPDLVATNGTSRGLYLFRSSSITVTNATVSGSDVGVGLASTQSSSLWDVDARGSATGALLARSQTNVIARLDARGATRGVHVGDGSSGGNVVFGVDGAGITTSIIDDPTLVDGRADNLLVDAGRDVRVGVGRPARFASAITASRFETDRIVEQTWDFGDGVVDGEPGSTPYRPAHLYAQPGAHVVTLTVNTSEGRSYSDTAHVTVVGPMTAPEGVRAAVGAHETVVAWREPRSDGGLPIVGYRVYRGTDLENGQPVYELDADVRFWVDDGTLGGFYAVAALNDEGEGPRSAWAEARDGATPGAPANFTATPSGGRVALTWDAPSDDGGLRVAAYEVYRYVADGQADLLAELGGDALTFNDTTVEDGTLYSYEVSAVNSLGPGATSPKLSVTPTPPPPAPRNLTALTGSHAATLLWAPPQTFGESPILHYRVYRREGARPEVLVGQVVDIVFRDERLSNHATYAYQVAAVTRVGEGNRSEPIEVSPQAIDENPPLIVSIIPPPGAVVSEVRPTFTVRYLDGSGAATVVLSRDGREVYSGVGSATELVHRPDEGLSLGIHRLHISVTDAAGHQVRREWTLRIATPEETVPRVAVTNVTLAAPELALGENITIGADVRNVGLVRAATLVELRANGVGVLTQPVDLEPGAVTNITFDWTPDSAGNFDVVVGDAAAAQLAVIGPDEPEPETAGNETADEGSGFLGIPAPTLPAVLIVVLAVAVALASRRRA